MPERRRYRSTVQVQLDGNQIRADADFHQQLAALLDFGPFYVRNLDALWTGRVRTFRDRSI